MAATVPTTEPTVISAGDNVLFTRSLADYPADAWTLTYVLSNGLHAYSFTAFADGTTFSVNTHSPVTALYAPGEYRLTGTVSDGVEQHTVYSGLLTVLPNGSVATPLEYRSWAAVALANIEAAIVIDAGRGSILEYTINGRSVRASFSEAIKMRDYLLSQVNIANNLGGSQRKILTRFRGARGTFTEPFV